MSWVSTILVKVTLFAAVGFCSLAGAATTPATPLAGPEHIRGVEQTLLTYPEWFLVFSPYEYGEYIDKSAPSRFPYYGHISQFWESYQAVFKETRRRKLEQNPGYHLMIMVIGISTSVEYAIKSAYETLVGRLTEASSSARTPEDNYAALVAKDYVRFIRVQPWYEYNFDKALAGLWRDLPSTGPNMLRKWERRFALTTEYLIKTSYARLIKLGTQSIYDAALPVTAVVMMPAPAANANLPELKLIAKLPGDAVLATVPRYEAFTAYAQALAMQGISFGEIAGNDSFILVSVLAPDAWSAASPGAQLFAQPILTQPGTKRVVLTVPVKSLAAALNQWQSINLQVEHIFDY